MEGSLMMHLIICVMANSFSCGKRPQKYTAQQLQEIEHTFAQFDVTELIKTKEPGIGLECAKFLKDKLVIHMTSAQQMYNMRQKHAGHILTFDMRSRAQYHAAHIIDSVSFPVDLCDEDFFIRWNPEAIQRDIIKNKEKGVLFKNRKRMFISIVAGNEEVQNLLKVLPMVFCGEHLDRIAECPIINGRKMAQEDVRKSLLTSQVLSLRNAILLIKALRNERIREVHLCANRYIDTTPPYLTIIFIPIIFPEYNN